MKQHELYYLFYLLFFIVSGHSWSWLQTEATKPPHDDNVVTLRGGTPPHKVMVPLATAASRLTLVSRPGVVTITWTETTVAKSALELVDLPQPLLATHLASTIPVGADKAVSRGNWIIRRWRSSSWRSSRSILLAAAETPG